MDENEYQAQLQTMRAWAPILRASPVKIVNRILVADIRANHDHGDEDDGLMCALVALAKAGQKATGAPTIPAPTIGAR